MFSLSQKRRKSGNKVLGLLKRKEMAKEMGLLLAIGRRQQELADTRVAINHLSTSVENATATIRRMAKLCRADRSRFCPSALIRRSRFGFGCDYLRRSARKEALEFVRKKNHIACLSRKLEADLLALRERSARIERELNRSKAVAKRLREHREETAFWNYRLGITPLPGAASIGVASGTSPSKVGGMSCVSSSEAPARKCDKVSCPGDRNDGCEI